MLDKWHTIMSHTNMNKEDRTANSTYPKDKFPWVGGGEIPLPFPISSNTF